MGLNLGKQIGPLPAGAWLGVVGGGLALGYFINKRQGNASTEDEQPVLTDPNSDVGVGGGQFQYDPIESVPNPAPPEDNDNAAWGRKGVNYLTSLGYAGTYAQNVMNKFLAGVALTPAEKLLIDQVILRFGSPPEPTAPVDETPNIPTPGTPPSTPVKLPAVTGLAVRQSTRVNTLVWQYKGPVIGGFHLLIKDLKTGHTKEVLIGQASRSYRHSASPAWTKRSAGKQQYTLRPFRGGFTAKKTYGPAITVSATHRF